MLFVKIGIDLYDRKKSSFCEAVFGKWGGGGGGGCCCELLTLSLAQSLYL